MTQVISLETAKLFLEAELSMGVESIDDLQTLSKLEYEFYYCPDGGYGEKLLDHDYGIATRIDRNGWTIYPAFDQEQLKTYLRKAHKIIVEPFYISSDHESPEFLFMVHKLMADGRKMVEQLDDDPFMGETFEDALEAGLQVGINLMKE